MCILGLEVKVIDEVFKYLYLLIIKEYRNYFEVLVLYVCMGCNILK